MNSIHSWSAFLSTVSDSNFEAAHTESSFPFNFNSGIMKGLVGSVPSGGLPGAAMAGPMGALGAGASGPMQGAGGTGSTPGNQPYSGQKQGLPLSQPPPKPSFQKMYVKTTPVESFSALVSTTHISFLWTMLMLAGGVAIGMACMAPRKKKEKAESDKDSSDSSSSSSSHSSE